MTLDDLIFILKFRTDVKLQLLAQIKSLEVSGDDPDLLKSFENRLSVICSIGKLMRRLPKPQQVTIEEQYTLPEANGPYWKRYPTRIQRALLPEAIRDLLDLVNQEPANLDYYRQWRFEIERRVMAFFINYGQPPEAEHISLMNHSCDYS